MDKKNKIMKILVVDYHIGISISITANLKKIFGDENVDVCVVDPIDYWSHENTYEMWGCSEFLIPNFTEEYNEAKRRIYELESISIDNQNRTLLAGKKMYNDYLYDFVFVSFPPSLAYIVDAANIAPKIHIILGHRLDFGSKHFDTTSWSRETFFDYIKKNNWNVTSCNNYDKEYFEYYMGRPIENLPLVAVHALKFYKEVPNKDSIFIGPFDAKNTWRKDLMNLPLKTFGELGSVEDIANSLSKKINKNISFKKDKKIPAEEISLMSAIINMPYSAWSASEYEYHAMGIPLFVPDNDLIIKNDIMDDRALWPLYADESDIKMSEKKYQKIDIPSPQSKDPDAQDYWINKRNLKNKTFYEFNNLDDLSNKINNEKYLYIRNDIYQNELKEFNIFKSRMLEMYGG